MKAVVTIWNERVAPVFDVAGRALIIEREGTAVLSEKDLALPEGSAIEKILFLARHGVEVLICGAISRPARLTADGYGMVVHAFIAGEVRDVVRAWLDGRLDESGFDMPGCGRRRNGCRLRDRNGRQNGPGAKAFPEPPRCINREARAPSMRPQTRRRRFRQESEFLKNPLEIPEQPMAGQNRPDSK